MEPVTMALLAGGLAAGGAGANYLGGQSEARRRRRALRRARSAMASLDAEDQAITNRAIEAQSQAGSTRQLALLQALQGMGQGAMPQAQGQVDAVQQQANAYAGDMPAATTDVGQAAAARVATNRAPTVKARQALALLQALGVQEGRSQAAGQTQALTADIPLMRHLTQAGMDQQDVARRRAQVEAELNGTLSTTGNEAANLQLLGGLLNAGAQGGFMFAGRTPGATPSQGTWV